MFKLFARRRGRATDGLPDVPVEAAWLPYLSSGACLYSAVVAYQLNCGCSKERAIADIYGARIRTPLNLFGIGANEITRKLFSGLLESTEVLKRHTLFGVYGATLSESDEAGWAEELANGGGTPFSLASHLYLRAGPLALWNELRFCPKCVEDDISDGRLPEWKVLHQLPFLICCHRHETTLISRCRSCQKIFDRGSDFRIPGQPCRSCGMLPMQVVSEGIQDPDISLGTISNDLLENSLEILRPPEWNKLIKGFVLKSGGRREAIRAIRNSLQARWRVKKIDQILRTQGYMVDTQTLESEIDLLAVNRPFLRMLIFDVLSKTFGKSLDQLGAQSELEIEKDREAIYARAAAANIPIGVVDLVLEGQSFELASRASIGVKYTRMRDFFQSLPVALSTFIAKNRPEKSAKMDRVGVSFYGIDPVNLRREVFMKLIIETPDASRTKLRTIASILVNWLYRNDREWLDEVLPCKVVARPRQKFLSFTEERKAKREMITKFKSNNPGCNRSKARRGEQAACRWLFEHDRAWIERQLPRHLSAPGTRNWYRYYVPFKEPSHKLPRLYANDMVRKEAYIAYVREIIELNPHLCRSEVERAAAAPVSWLRKHNRSWLERLLPAALRRPRAK